MMMTNRFGGVGYGDMVILMKGGRKRRRRPGFSGVEGDNGIQPLQSFILCCRQLNHVLLATGNFAGASGFWRLGSRYRRPATHTLPPQLCAGGSTGVLTKSSVSAQLLHHLGVAVPRSMPWRSSPHNLQAGFPLQQQLGGRTGGRAKARQTKCSPSLPVCATHGVGGARASRQSF